MQDAMALIESEDIADQPRAYNSFEAEEITKEVKMMNKVFRDGITPLRKVQTLRIVTTDLDKIVFDGVAAIEKSRFIQPNTPANQDDIDLHTYIRENSTIIRTSEIVTPSTSHTLRPTHLRHFHPIVDSSDRVSLRLWKWVAFGRFGEAKCFAASITSKWTVIFLVQPTTYGASCRAVVELNWGEIEKSWRSLVSLVLLFFFFWKVVFYQIRDHYLVSSQYP
jgi:hypothetical protein